MSSLQKAWTVVCAVLILALVVSALWSKTARVTVGSKAFTEGVILGEIGKQVIQSKLGITQVFHQAELGGTRIVWNALLGGNIDVYAEYTGTLTQEIFAGQDVKTTEELKTALAAKGVRMTAPLGFSDGYALGIRRELADRLHLETISDLRKHPELKFGLTNEFLDRADGWPSLKKRYELPQSDLKGLDHDIAYRALESGDIQVLDLYSTDAEIQYYDLKVLTDDLHYFPLYEAVYLYRADLQSRAPEAIEALRRVERNISETEMVKMNAAAKQSRIKESVVASNFLRSKLGIDFVASEELPTRRIARYLKEHLNLVVKSMGAAILVAVPLGVWAFRHPGFGQVVLGFLGILQTIPALALLVVLIRPLNALGLRGIGDAPAIVALFIYSLLPIVRNTHAGLNGLALQVRESAEALGLPPRARLRLIELPLALPMILAGIKTAAVINVGFATLGALVGAGGFGQPILTGIRLDNYELILEGAVPSAVLALLVQGAFELVERRLVPKGLRLRA